MNYLINFLQFETEVPRACGCYHFLCLFAVFIAILWLIKYRPKLNKVLFAYSSIAFVLELLKQIFWSIQLDGTSVIWDYQWYAFPFQLCTTPIYACFIILLIKNEKIKTALYSYLAYVTILGSIVTMLYPVSCFVPDVLVNIHAMWLHGGSLVVSIYLLSSEKELNYKNSIAVFLIFVCFANLLNIVVYNRHILVDETFNMFYISPYFVSSLPVFDVVYENTHYLVFLIFYLFAIVLGSYIVYCISKLVKYRQHTNKRSDGIVKR